MRTLFPPPQRAGVAPARAKRQLKRVKHFVKQLGEHPRVIFKLRPLTPEEAQAIRRRQRVRRRVLRQVTLNEIGDSAESAASPPPQAEKPPAPKDPCKALQKQNRLAAGDEQQNAVYLMPLDARHLTRERSLIKYGGGNFTVVGKMVRIFTEPSGRRKGAYIDSSTRETWTQALRHAPLKLLCGTDPDCRELAHAKGKKKGAKAKAKLVDEKIRASRCTDLAALREQTEIPVRGAVILPIAIYK